MKKVLCLLIAVVLIISLFTACGKNDEVDFLETITFEKIAQVNSMTNLLKNYDSITERTVNKNMDGEEEFYWDLSYEKKENNINAIVDTGNQYKCYYYNGKIFACYEGEYLPVLYFRETYNDIVAETISRDNLLNSIYHTVSSREKLKDGRYVVTFEFKVNSDMVSDFEPWGIKEGQIMNIVYFLKENLEIDHYDYYVYDAKGNKVNIANVYFDYNSEFTFPEEVINLVQTKDLCKVTLYENYSFGSQYSEVYEVPKGSYLEINSYLYAYNIYANEEMDVLWDFENDAINEDTSLYLYEEIYYDLDEEMGEEIITGEETENE